VTPRVHSGLTKVTLRATRSEYLCRPRAAEPSFETECGRVWSVSGVTGYNWCCEITFTLCKRDKAR